MKTRLFVCCLLITLALPTSIVSAKITTSDRHSSLPQDDNNILFEDDFSDPDSGWNTRIWNAGSTGYENGEYVITLTQSSASLFGGIVQSFTDISIEVDVLLVQEESDRQVGIICRGQMSGDHYSFYLSNRGAVNLAKVINGQLTRLTDWIDIGDVYQSGINHLQAVCAGSSLQFFVNGQLAASSQDNTLADGMVALMASAFGDVPYSAHFDNIVITDAEGYSTTEQITGTITLPYEDDFSDPDSGWNAVTLREGSTGCDNGEYVITITQAGAYISGGFNQLFMNISFEADTNQVKEKNERIASLYCRGQANGDHYGFNLSNLGYVLLDKVVNREDIALTDWIDIGDVYQSGANHLQAVCEGSSLQFFVNGQLVAEAQDDTLGAGQVGFKATSFSGVPYSVSFDNVVLSDPSSD